MAGKLALKPELICSGSRQKKIAEGRALVAYLAVEETGHKAADVARYLGIGRANVLRSIKRGREIQIKQQKHQRPPGPCAGGAYAVEKVPFCFKMLLKMG